MKDKKNTNSQEIYRVRLFKDFDFPSYSINRDNKLSDIRNYLSEEIKGNNTIDYYQFEIKQVLPFSLENSLENETTGNTNYDFLTNELALEETKEKYGELNYETNPSIFIKDNLDSISINYRLKSEVESFYIKKIQKLNSVIREKMLLH